MSKTFNYFGFGSNLLAKRIHLQNPTAVRVGVGLLKDYRLDFSGYSTRWLGAPATIVPTPGACVYGAIWLIDASDLQHLDKQEGVDAGVYAPLQLPIIALDTNEPIMCRIYQLVEQPAIELCEAANELVPCERQPSETYLKTIVKGAVETGLPDEYISVLKCIKHNGRNVENLFKELELSDVVLKQ